MLKLIAILVILSKSGLYSAPGVGTTDKACFLPLNDYVTTNDGYQNMYQKYFQFPFDNPLKNQNPVCPNADKNIECPKSQRYRTADGSCNNLIYKWWGSSFTPYQRLLQPEYTTYRDIRIPRVTSKLNQALPDPRLVTNKLSNNVVHTGLNAWYTFFGVLVAHDLAQTERAPYVDCQCDNKEPECFNIIIKTENENKIKQCFDETSPFTCKIDPSEQSCIPFPRSADVRNVFDCGFETREQFTRGTHFLDMDNVYGASAATARNIRSYSKGELKVDRVDDVTSLPILDINECLKTKYTFTDTSTADYKTEGCIYAGDQRVGEQTFLSITTLLLHRAHNKIAQGLSAVNAHWKDETIYQEARRILVAAYQNIVYSEYLEIALGNNVMAEFSLSPLTSGYNWNYDDYLYPNNYNEFVTAAFRLHSTVHTEIKFLDSEFEDESITIAGSSITSADDIKVDKMFFNSWLYYSKINTLMFSFAGEGTYAAQFGLTASLNHFIPMSSDNADKRRFSLGAANIQRGRDHGIPGYTEYRHLSGSEWIKSWEDLEDVFTKPTITTLKTLYEQPHDIDLWVGLIAEKPEQTQLLAKTQRWLIGKNFFALKYGDRFYYENGQDNLNRFSEPQLDNIRKFRFASLMCLGFGEFTDDNKMPMEGFFMPDTLTKDFDCTNECTNDSGECTNKPPKNPIVDCSSLATIDYNLWFDMSRVYYQ
jgi:peroxidase